MNPGVRSTPIAAPRYVPTIGGEIGWQGLLLTINEDMYQIIRVER